MPISPNHFQRTRKWNGDLKPDSISSNEQYCHMFMNVFASSTPRELYVAELNNMYQQLGESLNEYLIRFNTMARRVVEKDEVAIIEAFIQGIAP